jgi:ubiquitin thioesterase OTU1
MVRTPLSSTTFLAFSNPTVCANAAGEGKGYKQRVFLVYDGLHYDAFGLNFAPDGPEDFDTTVFSPRDDYVSNNALSIVRSLKEKHLYTDTGSFQLLCGDCQAGTFTHDHTTHNTTH